MLDRVGSGIDSVAFEGDNADAAQCQWVWRATRSYPLPAKTSIASKPAKTMTTPDRYSAPILILRGLAARARALTSICRVTRHTASFAVCLASAAALQAQAPRPDTPATSRPAEDVL